MYALIQYLHTKHKYKCAFTCWLTMNISWMHKIIGFLFQHVILGNNQWWMMETNLREAFVNHWQMKLLLAVPGKTTQQKLNCSSECDHTVMLPRQHTVPLHFIITVHALLYMRKHLYITLANNELAWCFKDKHGSRWLAAWKRQNR